MIKVDTNIVFVGNKRVCFYLDAVLTLLAQGHDEIILKARGKNNNNAIRVANAAKTKIGNIEIEHVEIGEEEFENGGKKRKVATITIKLVRKKE